MEKIKVASGLYWIAIPEADLFVQCGCPADSVKHLIKRGFIGSTEKNGIPCETGPNAILLSDIPIQKGNFSNLAEFPVLQMLYRQGMILPGHPNNNGRKPLLIGSEDQIRAQSEYIYRGNYGLATQEEIESAGIFSPTAKEMTRMKRKFAFDAIRRTEDLLDLRVVDRDSVEIRPDVFVKRNGLNRYEFSCGRKSVEVDLNLLPDEEYEPPYQLGFQRIEREYFSIIHVGEGDGWADAKPCMGSIVCFQGRLYLIDAGPNILHTLVSLGINVSELQGIFQTHCHDDHFAGLTSLIRLDRRLKYYAAAYVRMSVEKKLAALMGMRPGEFATFFDVCDIVPEVWNDVQGLEVMPIFSPHPVETTVFFFRTPWAGGYRTYAHLADITDFKVLRGMVNDDQGASGVTTEFFASYIDKMLEPVDVKKIDAGGGLIHGNALDFAEDRSRSIFISHKAVPLTGVEKEIGSSASFGSQEVLIRGAHDLHAYRMATRHLSDYFPSIPVQQLLQLANCPVVSFNAGTIIVRHGTVPKHLYLILDGVVEYIESEQKATYVLSGGALIGELVGMGGEPARATFRAASHLKTLEIPRDMYLGFVQRNCLQESIMRAGENRKFLQGTWLFGDTVSFTVQNSIAQSMEQRYARVGQSVRVQGRSEIAILQEGEVSISSGGRIIERLWHGGFWGEVTILHRAPSLFEAHAERDCTFFLIPGETLSGIPSVHWKLMEVFRRRLSWFRDHARLEWIEDYALGIGEIDEQHCRLFTLVNDLAALFRYQAAPGRILELRQQLVRESRLHFETEKAIMEKLQYPDLEHHLREHKELLEQIARLDDPESLLRDTLHENIPDFLKDWVLTHTLLEDRRFRAFLQERAGG
jgi:hemerythrin